MFKVIIDVVKDLWVEFLSKMDPEMAVEKAIACSSASGLYKAFGQLNKSRQELKDYIDQKDLLMRAIMSNFKSDYSGASLQVASVLLSYQPKITYKHLEAAKDKCVFKKEQGGEYSPDLLYALQARVSKEDLQARSKKDEGMIDWVLDKQILSWEKWLVGKRIARRQENKQQLKPQPDQNLTRSFVAATNATVLPFKAPSQSAGEKLELSLKQK